MKRPELLIPAGNLEKLRTAILYGADAVYVGTEGLSLRANQAELNMVDLEIGITEAHQKGVKVYAAINIFAKNKDLESVQKAVGKLNKMDIDGVILSDPGVLRLVKKVNPDLPVHLSTQANVTNGEAVKFWHDQGVRRIVLARELNLSEIAEIGHMVPEMELELFVHGAMCVAYSGRCFLSAYRNGKSSNHGECTQPCRWEYLLQESTRPGQPLILEEDQRYSYLLSSKDLCMIEHLPEIMKAGVVSLKVEGRMKSAYYVAVAARTYRWAVNALMKEQDTYHSHMEWLLELEKISNRGYTTGFYFAGDQRISETEPNVKYYQATDFVAIVISYDSANSRLLVEVRNRLTVNDQIELLLPEKTIVLNAAQMTDMFGIPLHEAHNVSKVYLPVGQPVPSGAIIRRIRGDS